MLSGSSLFRLVFLIQQTAGAVLIVALQGAVSWLWGVTAISKLVFTMDPVPAVADLIVDAAVCASTLLVLIYIATVTGPLQWWTNDASSKKTIVYAGVWETIGSVILIVLLYAKKPQVQERFLLTMQSSAIHIFHFLRALRSSLFGRKVESRCSSPKPRRSKRRRNTDEEASLDSPYREISMDPWFRKYMGPASRCSVATRGDRQDRSKRKMIFDLPLHKSKSELHVNRLGNSWDCSSVIKS